MMFSFLNQVGFKIDNKALSLMAPCKDTFRRDVKKLGCETLIILRKQIVGQCLCYACDAANKGGYHHMVKKIAWHHYEKSELNVVVLDSDVCDGTDMDAVEALNNSFLKLDPISGPKVFMHGQRTDAGGGGTSSGLATEMTKHDRLADNLPST